MSVNRPIRKRIPALSADVHRGTVSDFLRAHRAEAFQAAWEGREATCEFAAKLLPRVADTRNLRIAWQYLSQQGGPAPGPDGFTYADFSPTDVCGLAKSLEAPIRTGLYVPGGSRTVHVPKGGNRGSRPLVLRNIADRVVERGIVQIVQPLIDPDFDERSFGYRPRRGHWHALAALDALIASEGRSICVSIDLRDAFEHVPLQRLLDVVRKKLFCPKLVGLIGRVIEQPRGRGLRQGGPLSPLLLNMYLDHFLDRPWRRDHSSVPFCYGLPMTSWLRVNPLRRPRQLFALSNSC